MKNIKKMLSALICSVAATAPCFVITNITFGTEATQGDAAVDVVVTYDNDIQPSDGDKFVITYSLKSDMSKTATITVDTSKFANEKGTLNMPANDYVVLGIKYEGQNAGIINQGYGIIKDFSSSSSHGMIKIAVGDKSCVSIEADYGAGSVCIMNSDRDSSGNIKIRDDMPTPTPYGQDDMDNEQQTVPGILPNESNIPENNNGDINEENGSSENAITDTGEAKVEKYLDENKDSENKDDVKEKQKNKKDRKKTALRKLAGVFIFAIIGFAIIFGLHAKGKI